MPDGSGNDDLDRLVDTFEAARMFGQTPGHLRHLRVSGHGCPYIKLGRTVRYVVRDIMTFKAANRVSSTSEHWAA